MDQTQPPLNSQGQPGLQWAPIHSCQADTPASLCLLLQEEGQSGEGPFVLLREVPGSRVYLGGLCDAAGRVWEWLEIWVQEPEVKSATFSSQGKPLDNNAFDAHWRSEFERARNGFPDSVLVMGMENKNPRPVLIKRIKDPPECPFAQAELASWRLCTDDDLLKSAGLPPYSTSCHRYLYDPGSAGKKAFVATTTDAPANANVRGIDQLLAAGEFQALFNPHAGLVRVTRFTPLELEDYLQVLEGRAWTSPLPQMRDRGIYSSLAQWSGQRKGMAFLLHQHESFGQRLDEVFFLKLTTLLELVKTVHAHVKAQQFPLLNLGPSSFRVSLPDVGDEFPALWGAKFHLVRPSQAYPLMIPFTKEKYFIRLGRIEPSPFLPEGLGAYSFGIGSIRLRQVALQEEGVVLEGTLIAEDYLGVNAQDLLWFKLPLREERLEFFANIHTAEPVGPKEARFRTIPTTLPEPLVAKLKASAGTVFQRAPYEICPLLSSPCDLFSLGVIGTRILLANSRSNLPVIVDEVLSLVRRVAKEPNGNPGLASGLKKLASRDRDLLDRLSPHALIESGDSPEQARAKLPLDLWWEALAILFRFFPGLGPQSFCQGLGDTTPEALESVFDRPVAELEKLVHRLRNILLPSVAANQELAQMIRDQLG
jgi:hypothetical protein